VTLCRQVVSSSLGRTPASEFCHPPIWWAHKITSLPPAWGIFSSTYFTTIYIPLIYSRCRTRRLTAPSPTLNHRSSGAAQPRSIYLHPFILLIHPLILEPFRTVLKRGLVKDPLSHNGHLYFQMVRIAAPIIQQPRVEQESSYLLGHPSTFLPRIEIIANIF
jgi:hypothetical protein